jgi:3-hydroxymyristoyl/3-hydroxydecanoyl-(acyl carrier protein) dehydratase
MTLSTFSEIIHSEGPHDGAIGHTDLKKYLRHRHPMIGVDQVLKHDFKSGWLHAVRAVSSSHPAFEGHFDDAAIYPGTNLTQDIIQLGIVLFLGTTRPLQGDGRNQEMTAVSELSINLGHPVAPGTILDVALWRTAEKGPHAIWFNFEAKVRNFPYYDESNSMGMTFKSAITGSAQLIRVKRKVYEGIGF